MNKDFEKLPEIKKLLDGGDVYWCEHGGKYRGYDEDFANGALYAYQEQQRKIDNVLKFLNGYDSIDIDNIVELRDCVSEI